MFTSNKSVYVTVEAKNVTTLNATHLHLHTQKTFQATRIAVKFVPVTISHPHCLHIFDLN